MTPEERFARFKKIREHFHTLDRERLEKGQLAMGETSHGFWGTTNMNDAYELFKRIKLDEKQGFVDLGAGDGRIVAIASLFTNAVGVEGDTDLVKIGIEAKDSLGMDIDLKEKDYYDEDLSQYDVVFMFPDKEYDARLIGKLLAESKGTLYIYNNIYLPPGLKKGKTIWIEQLPVASYPLDSK